MTRLLMATLWMLASTTGCRGPLVAAGLSQPTAARLDRHGDFRWVRDTTPHFLIRAESGSAAATRIDSLGRGLESAMHHVRATLALGPETEPVHAFAVASADRMDALLGRRVDGRAFFGTRVLAFAMTPTWQATARHELTHVLLRTRWSGDPEQWISEGVATDVGNPFHGRDVHQLVRERLITSGRVLPLRALAREFGRHPNEVTYLQSASIARYIRERFGIDVLRAIWAGGLAAIPAATGLDLERFEGSWRRTVEQRE